MLDDLAERIGLTEGEREQLRRAAEELNSFRRLSPMLESVLARLPEEEYLLLFAYYYEDQSPSRIARQFEYSSPEQVEEHLNEARKRLCDRLGENDLEVSPDQAELLLRADGKHYRKDRPNRDDRTRETKKPVYEAEVAYQKRLLEQEPTPERQKALANAYGRLGEAQAAIEHWKKAEASFRRQFSLRRELCERRPSMEILEDLATACYNLGVARLKQGKRKEAESSLAESLRLFEQLLDKSPTEGYREARDNVADALAQIRAEQRHVSGERVPEERLETEVGASEEGPIEDEDPRATALKALIIAFARRQQRALQCFRRPRFRLRGGGVGEQAVESLDDLARAIDGLLSGEEEEVLRELSGEEGTEGPKEEGLSFRLRYEAGEEGGEGAVVFEDVHPAGWDSPAESFQLRFEEGDRAKTFEGEDGSVRVPIEVLTDLLGERYTLSIEH